MLKTGDSIPNLQFAGAHDKPVALASYWSEAPTIVVFLRHFG